MQGRLAQLDPEQAVRVIHLRQPRIKDRKATSTASSALMVSTHHSNNLILMVVFTSRQRRITASAMNPTKIPQPRQRHRGRKLNRASLTPSVMFARTVLPLQYEMTDERKKRGLCQNLSPLSRRVSIARLRSDHLWLSLTLRWRM